MTDIERKALALINEVRLERGIPAPDYISARAALIRAIEQYETFRQEVSDAVGAYLAHMSPWPDNSLRRFIITKPDPLVEALNEAGDTNPLSDDAFANAFRAALAARGLKIVEVE